MKSLYANQTRDSGLALLPAFVKEDTQPIAEIPIQKIAEIPIQKFAEIPIQKFAKIPIQKFAEVPIESEEMAIQKMEIRIQMWKSKHLKGRFGEARP